MTFEHPAVLYYVEYGRDTEETFTNLADALACARAQYGRVYEEQYTPNGDFLSRREIASMA